MHVYIYIYIDSCIYVRVCMHIEIQIYTYKYISIIYTYTYVGKTWWITLLFSVLVSNKPNVKQFHLRHKHVLPASLSNTYFETCLQKSRCLMTMTIIWQCGKQPINHLTNQPCGVILHHFKASHGQGFTQPQTWGGFVALGMQPRVYHIN